MEVLRRSSVFAAEVMEVFDRSPTDKELVSQAKALCRDYINSRLIQAGVSWSKPEYNAPVPGGKLAEVSTILLRLGDELEYIRPNVYRNIARQLNISLHSETVVSDAFLAVAAQIFSAGITWGKVVSLYAVAAGLAVDCVRHAQPAMVHTIVDCLGEFVRKTLVTWLKRRGGWIVAHPELLMGSLPQPPHRGGSCELEDWRWSWTPAPRFFPAWRAESSPKWFFIVHHHLCSLLFILPCGWEDWEEGRRQLVWEYGRRGPRCESWGWSSDSLSHSWFWGSGGSCSSAPIPWHFEECPKRTHPHAWKQHLMGQEVRREHTCLPTCFPSISPTPGKHSSPCSAWELLPHPWEAAGRTLHSSGLSLSLRVGTNGTRHPRQLQPLCMEHEDREG
uniref:BCL2 family apoptosis regulator BOK n=1 Tax=Taeniopygia guttata TaxID=59729 RepID=A0A674HBJ4_TAEGU